MMGGHCTISCSSHMADLAAEENMRADLLQKGLLCLPGKEQGLIRPQPQLRRVLRARPPSWLAALRAVTK